MTTVPAVPGNEEAEVGVLSCLLTNPRTIMKVMDILKPDYFQDDRYQAVYESIIRLYGRGKVATLPNVREELRRMNRYADIGDNSLLDNLKESLAPVMGSITDYAETVRDTYTYRRGLAIAGQMAEMAYHRDPNMLSWVEEALTQLVLGADHKPVATMAEAVDRYMTAYEQRREDFHLGKTAGVPTGFRDLDRLLGGLFPSRLYTLAARPSIGKTAISLNIALNMVRKAQHVLFFSGEMDEEEILQRLFSMETHIDQTLLRDANTNDEQDKLIHQTARELRTLDLKVDDRVMTLTEICHKARQVHAQKPLKLIVVDYIQLMDVTSEGRGKNELRSEEVGKLSKGLKRLARELKVPVLALAQLNRKSEESELPQLSHLAESGKLEQDSDIVMFLHIDESELDKRNRSEVYRLNVLVRKHRNGRIGKETLVFDPCLTRFDNLLPEYNHER